MMQNQRLMVAGALNRAVELYKIRFHLADREITKHGKELKINYAILKEMTLEILELENRVYEDWLKNE